MEKKTQLTTAKRLPFTFGFEMTGLVSEYTEKSNGQPTKDTEARNEIYSQLIALDLEKRWPGNFDHDEYYYDGHCVEFPSPVFTNWPKAVEFYRAVRKSFKKFKITPQREGTVCGGNHLHFKGFSDEEVRRILRETFHRPYLPWVFTQPDDTASCNNLFTLPGWTRLQATLDIPRWKPAWATSWNEAGRLPYPDPAQPCLSSLRDFQRVLIKRHSVNSYCMFSFMQFLCTDLPFVTSPSSYGAKELMVAYDDENKIEFRCVEAPRYESEFTDQFEFFSRFVLWAAKHGSKPLRTATKEEMQAVTPREMANRFNALCSTLGLDSKRYAKYVRRNLYPRWQLGRSRT